MKYKVMYTAGAKKDLRNIFRYISEELLASENAAGQTERIMTAIRKLDTMPNRNRLYEEEPWHSRGLRFFPVDNYLVFYKTEYSCAMKSHFRKFGNQMSGSGNHLCNYASLLA